ncbi:hypothetical protein [Telluria beijingensis]|uniref:hypothetical protein n=1 Tax=Telluria beijingensis TaxID=3068633 RepID=UPI002795A097|nr:hypothetical protein [Massilia sp. REN29]
MNLQMMGAAKRLIFSLLLASGIGGCAVYGPPYAIHDAGYAPAYGYSTYSTYPADSYYGGYPYTGPAYAYPPLSLGLGFSYYDRGPRHDRGHGWGHRHRGGHEWRGHRGGRGDHGQRGRGRDHRRR